MSATNRGTKRIESDFYATPLEAVETLLRNYDDISPEDSILEPAAGNGNIIQALRENGFKNQITAIEIREEEFENLESLANVVAITDFLDPDPEITKKFDVIISNPPYTQAQEFIDKSLALLKPGGGG